MLSNKQKEMYTNGYLGHVLNEMDVINLLFVGFGELMRPDQQIQGTGSRVRGPITCRIRKEGECFGKIHNRYTHTKNKSTTS